MNITANSMTGDVTISLNGQLQGTFPLPDDKAVRLAFTGWDGSIFHLKEVYIQDSSPTTSIGSKKAAKEIAKKKMHDDKIKSKNADSASLKMESVRFYELHLVCLY